MRAVKKHGKEIWTVPGGKPEQRETEEQALLREIKEETGGQAEIIRKPGDNHDKAIFDDAMLKLSIYITKINGELKITYPKLEQIKFLSQTDNIQIAPNMKNQVIPALIKEKLLNWQ
ncbi:NUDIX domain-containing protein [Candidatus Woesearchaeota archaeon]|nr:NUDIX domain-containing protein [Candidatus Woesearchaeota archaeon]